MTAGYTALDKGSGLVPETRDDTGASWWMYFPAQAIWLPVHALAVVDKVYHGDRGRVVQADMYHCPVCNLDIKSLDALRTHLGVLELAAITRPGRDISRVKRSPHCIVDVEAFTRAAGIPDLEVVELFRCSEKFPLDMFMNFPRYTRKHPNWKTTVRKALLAASGEKHARVRAMHLVKTGSIPVHPGLSNLVVQWHAPLQGSTRAGISHAVDVMIRGLDARGACKCCMIVEAKVQGRVNKTAWYKSFFTNVAGTLLTTGRIDGYVGMQVKERSFSTVIAALVDGYPGHPMHAGSHVAGGIRWNVTRLAGGRVVHSAFQHDATGALHATVKIGSAGAGPREETTMFEHEASFPVVFEPLPWTHATLRRTVDSIIDKLARSASCPRETAPVNTTTAVNAPGIPRDRIGSAVVAMATRWVDQGRAISPADVQVALGLSLDQAQGVVKHLLSTGLLVRLEGNFKQAQLVARAGTRDGDVPVVRWNTQVKLVTLPVREGVAVNLRTLARATCARQARLLDQLGKDPAIDDLAMILGARTHGLAVAGVKRWSLSWYTERKIKPALVRYLAWIHDQCLRYNDVHLASWGGIPSFFSWNEEHHEIKKEKRDCIRRARGRVSSR